MNRWSDFFSFSSGQRGEFDSPRIIAKLLELRGIKPGKETEDFLHPKMEDLVLEGIKVDKQEVEKACERIIKAKIRKEMIVVYCDYDADGITCGAIVWETLFRNKIRAMPYIPHRVSEGYGLTEKGIDRIIHDFKPGLIISVDQGISSHEAISYAKKKGIDCIVIDHHVMPDRKPEAFSLIHNLNLSASGLSWLFCRYLQKKMKPGVKEDNLKDLELAAIGTVADMVPLTGVNRAIVKFGLEKLKNTKIIGLKALMKEAGIDRENLSVHSISHIMAPRINAMGRISHALEALRLICTRDYQRAEKLSRTLGEANKLRQIMTSKAFLCAVDIVNFQMKRSKRGLGKLIIAAHKQFSQGIIGLVAGKLVEEYCRPCIVLSIGESYSKASARSVKGFNIVQALRKAEKHLVELGGHPMAAGFTIKTSELDIFSAKFSVIADGMITDEMLTKEVRIDLEIKLSDLSWELSNLLETLEPFGIGNPEPVFVSRNIYCEKAAAMGKDGSHLRLYLSDGDGSRREAVGFGLGDYIKWLKRGCLVDAVYVIRKDYWNGEKRLQLILRDVRLSKTNCP